MADWLVEEGIAEHRAVRPGPGGIVAARIDWPGRLAAGQVEDAVLSSREAGSPRGTARFASGEEALVDRLPRDAQEGASLRLAVTRAALRERGRAKPAQARPTDAGLQPAPTLAENLRNEGHTVAIVRQFPAEADWTDVWQEVWDGGVAFAGGALSFHPTPAMTLIDVDGAGSPAALARAAVAPLAGALARFDLGGNIGIDFPTLATKTDRRAVDDALDEALDPWPHERTAMNGFGFVQIVARMERVSLLHRIQLSRPAAAARLLLRRAEHLDGPGTLTLTAHPALKAHLTEARLGELQRRSGRQVALSFDPALALEAGHAQMTADG